MVEGEGPSQGPETGGTQTAEAQKEKTAEREVQRNRIRIPEPMKQPLKRYIDNLTFQETSANRDAEVLRATDKGRKELGQPPIDPKASRRLAGRPKKEPFGLYRRTQREYEAALSDSSREIGRDRGIAFGERRGVTLTDKWRDFPVVQGPIISEREAEKRALALEVDVNGLLEFLDSRINHKNDNLIRAFLQLEVARGQLGRETDPHNRRALELEIDNRQNSVVRETREKNRVNLWREVLDQLSRGEINEREAEREVSRKMKHLEKNGRRASRPGRYRDEMIDQSRTDIRKVIRDREKEKAGVEQAPPESSVEEPPVFSPDVKVEEPTLARPHGEPPTRPPEEPPPPEGPPAPKFEEGARVTWVDEKGVEHSGVVRRKAPEK